MVSHAAWNRLPRRHRAPSASGRANLLWRARASLLLADKLVGRRRPDVLPAVGVLDSLPDAEGGHHDDGDGDDPSEQKHDVRRPPRPLDEPPHEPLAGLAADRADGGEPEEHLPGELADGEVLYRAAHRGEEDHKAGGRGADLRLEVERDEDGAEDHPAADAEQPRRGSGADSGGDEHPRRLARPDDVAGDGLDARLEHASSLRDVAARHVERGCAVEEEGGDVGRPVPHHAVCEVWVEDLAEEEGVDDEEGDHRAEESPCPRLEAAGLRRQDLLLERLVALHIERDQVGRRANIGRASLRRAVAGAAVAALLALRLERDSLPQGGRRRVSLARPGRPCRLLLRRSKGLRLRSPLGDALLDGLVRVEAEHQRREHDDDNLRQQQVEEHSEDDAHQLAALHEDGSLVVDQRPVHVRVPLRPEEGEVAARNSEDGPL
mmetsp:Transcript_3185/g.10505  ORF Transcript_3185/g.10505 Transcript_3185/m.10505 type:complete len:435 (-) Transcript_3185:305-1609(-)